ncbi:MAG: type II secretion system minor pseudopilin GspK [Rhodoferax sp.]
MKPGRQAGAAILTAMLTVVLVATLAASALWQQWRAVEVEAAERSRAQSGWVLNGALDWARLILREDARKGGADHLAEPWAVPLEQARLSTFLAADRSDALAADEAQDAFLSGQIVDLQSRLNVANLVQNGKVDDPSRLAFTRLFDQLNLPVTELAVMIDNFRLMQDGSAENRSNMTLPLFPREPEELAWVGLSAMTIARLSPYVTLLPVPTPVNLNTAAVEVIYACVDTFEMADATRFVRERDLSHLTALADAGKIAGSAKTRFNEAQHGVSSRFFEVRGNLQVEQTTVLERSVVQRDGMEVKTLWRKRGVAAPSAPLQ